jgi:hypothetical protein
MLPLTAPTSNTSSFVRVRVRITVRVGVRVWVRVRDRVWVMVRVRFL